MARKQKDRERLLGHHRVNAGTIERWFERAGTDSLTVRVFRRDDRGMWTEDHDARRTAEKNEWHALGRAVHNTRKTAEKQHPLTDAIDGYEKTAAEDRSLKALMLKSIAAEVRDADLTGDDEWLVALWRMVGLRQRERTGFVESAGEAPLRKGATKGFAQVQIVSAAETALKRLEPGVSEGRAETIAYDAARAIVQSVVEAFPIEAHEAASDVHEDAAEKLRDDVLEAWREHEGRRAFPDRDAVRVLVRRAMILLGMPKETSYRFFHGEHEAARRKRVAKGKK